MLRRKVPELFVSEQSQQFLASDCSVYFFRPRQIWTESAPATLRAPRIIFFRTFACSTFWPQKMIGEHRLVFCRYGTAIEGARPQMAPGWWEIQSNSGGRSSAAVADPSTAAELIFAGLFGVHRVIRFDYCRAWKLLPLRLWILQVLLGGGDWPVALKSSQQMRYSLFAASYIATEETTRTETVDSDWKM